MSERLLITYNEEDLERLNPPSESPDHSTPFVFQGRFQPREDRASWLAVACPVRLADPGVRQLELIHVSQMPETCKSTRN